jgi:hypothetical protein
MLNFCSYFDKNYLSKFLVLRDSFANLNCDIIFYVLPLDDFSYNFLKNKNFKNVIICNLNELEKKFPDLNKIKNTRTNIEYYFTLSPYLPIFLQEKFNLEKLSYIDVDSFFFKNPNFFYKSLKIYSIILIKQNFKEKYGKFNVGWISYNFLHQDTKKILEKWKIECTNWCYDKVEKNRYADQKYLDDWPLLSNDIIICDPKVSMFSPWDSKNKCLIKNIENFYCYHFQGLKFSKNYFISGIGIYNFNFERKFIKKFYSNYVILLKKKQKEENLEFIDNLSLRSGLIIHSTIIDKIYSRLKKIKFFLLSIIRMDFYTIN